MGPADRHLLFEILDFVGVHFDIFVDVRFFDSFGKTCLDQKHWKKRMKRYLLGKCHLNNVVYSGYNALQEPHSHICHMFLFSLCWLNNHRLELLENFISSWCAVFIRMELQSKLLVLFFYFFLIGSFFHTQNLIKVL